MKKSNILHIYVICLLLFITNSFGRDFYVATDGDDSNNGYPPSTGLEGAGTTPVVIEGAVTTGGVTSGPNFVTGRRTWIDILPE